MTNKTFSRIVCGFFVVLFLLAWIIAFSGNKTSLTSNKVSNFSAENDLVHRP
ncbi:MAG: hypothetical protein ACK5N8_02570 [Alphaproteobacteria bacterium]